MSSGSSIASMVPNPPGTQRSAQRSTSARRRTPVKTIPPYASMSPPAADASTHSAPGRRANTSCGPVKSSWVTRGYSAKTTGNSAAIFASSIRIPASPCLLRIGRRQARRTRQSGQGQPERVTAPQGYVSEMNLSLPGGLCCGEGELVNNPGGAALLVPPASSDRASDLPVGIRYRRPFPVATRDSTGPAHGARRSAGLPQVFAREAAGVGDRAVVEAAHRVLGEAAVVRCSHVLQDGPFRLARLLGLYLRVHRVVRAAPLGAAAIVCHERGPDHRRHVANLPLVERCGAQRGVPGERLRDVAKVREEICHLGERGEGLIHVTGIAEVVAEAFEKLDVV